MNRKDAEKTNTRFEFSVYDLAIAGIVFITSLVLYIITMCPAVYVGDSGEFILAGAALGIPHNPGYPLYTITGKIFHALIFWKGHAFRINLVSGVFASLTCGVVVLIARLIGIRQVLSAGSGLLLAVAAVMWSEATVAEVYTMHAFLFASLMLLILLWYQRGERRFMYAFAFVLGLSLTHHVSMVMYIPAFVVVFAAGIRQHRLRLEKAASMLVTCIMLGAIPGLIYSLLPLRALQEPPINWGNPDNWFRFTRHIFAVSHRALAIKSLSYFQYKERFFDILKYLWEQYLWLYILLIPGILWHGKRKRFAIVFFAILAGDLVYAMYLNNKPDIATTPFFIPSIILCSLIISYGFEAICSASKAIACGFLIIPVIFTYKNYEASGQSKNYMAYDYVSNMVGNLPKGSMVILRGDTIVFSTAYLFYLEKMRPDIKFYSYNANLFEDIYGFRQLSKPISNEEIERIMRDRILKLISDNMGNIYLSGRDIPIPQGSKLRCVGLAFKVVPEGSTEICPEALTAVPILRGLEKADIYQDSMIKFLAFDYYSRIAAWYMETGKKDLALESMAKAGAIGKDMKAIQWMTGVEYLKMGENEPAVNCFERAIELDPEYADAHNNLGYIYYVKGEMDKAAYEFELAVKYDPRQADALRNLGTIYFNNRGDANTAAYYWSLYLKLRPYDAEIYEAYKTITAVGR